MSRVDQFLQEQVEHLLATESAKTLFILKGFAIEHAAHFVEHPQSLLRDSALFSSGFLNATLLNEKWLEMIQTITLASKPLIGFYEELLALRDFLHRIVIDKIVIIENNCLSPWVPSLLEYGKSLELFDYLQQDHDDKEDEGFWLAQMYGDVKLLNHETALLLPTSVDDERVTTLPIWMGAGQQVQAQQYQYSVEIGTQDDWQYRYMLTHGEGASVILSYSVRSTSSATNGLINALRDLGIPYEVFTEEVQEKAPNYNPNMFRPLLQKYWGQAAEFRSLLFYKDPDRSRDTEEVSQGSLIAEVIDQCEQAISGEPFQNVFITAPTGAGKSILFQIPAIHLAEKYSCVTIVVSPLIALMNDQVDKLKRDRGISIAACINSTMSIEDRIDVIEQIKVGKVSLLYLAPELLLTIHLSSFLGGRKLGLVVIDEAHTVTSWGRDFRSDYWFLGDFLRKAKREGMIFPVMCLTATAVYSGEDDVVRDTILELGLEGRVSIHLGNVKRANISFDIVKHQNSDYTVPVEAVKADLMIKRLRACMLTNEKLLAYFPFRSQVDQLFSQLSRAEQSKIRRYHGGVPAAERRLAEKGYSSEGTIGLVCTKAFGMGVDVADIVHVIHYAPNGTLADYVQEIGRAARNAEIQGTAHIDFFNGDLRYARTLNDLSEMRQYQLREMLKKLADIYNAKRKRNLLISPETFEYLFGEDDAENRTKAGLLLLSKDLANKYTFPVLVVRPKSILSRNYINVPLALEQQFLSKYGVYAQRQDGQDRRIETAFTHGGEVKTLVYSMGNTYLVDMAGIWEQYYPNLTFGMFKKSFFDQKSMVEGIETPIASPRVKVEIRYALGFSDVLNKIGAVVSAIVTLFEKYRNSEVKQFTRQAFEVALNDVFEEHVLAHEKIALLLDIFTETVDEGAPYTYTRNQFRVLRKRKDTASDDVVYFVSSPAYASLGNAVNQMISQCQPHTTDDIFIRFYPLVPEKPLTIMPLLRLLELLELASYEVRGGEKAEVFIRINDPSKIQRLGNNRDYKNNVLSSIHAHHDRSIKLLAAFFSREMSTSQRWDLIEEYFLGNEEYVEGVLGIHGTTN